MNDLEPYDLARDAQMEADFAAGLRLPFRVENGIAVADSQTAIRFALAKAKLTKRPVKVFCEHACVFEVWPPKEEPCAQ